MSFLKTLASALGISQAGSADPVPASSKGTGDPKLPWRKMSMGGYETQTSAPQERHKFDLRYTAYGEVSCLYATHVSLHRPGADDAPFPNAVAMDIDFENQRAASVTLVNDGLGGFSSEDTFPEEIASMRAKHHGRIGELSAFEISRDNKSRRAIGALFHVLYLYARQARQMTCIFVRTDTVRVPFYEQMLGFKKLAVQGDVVLLAIELNLMKLQIRTWGGQHKEPTAEKAPYKLYPFFFPPQDEAGLLFRVLEHLGSATDSV